MSKRKVKPGYHIHHIDWNHNNNAPSNLIAIPAILHMVIHQYSVHDRDEIVKLYKIYLLAKEKSQDEIRELLVEDPELNRIDRHKWIELEKMPEPLSSGLDNYKDSVQLFFDF